MRRLLDPNHYPSVFWALFAGAVICLQPLHAEKPEMLTRAWQEYQFLSMEIAEVYFEKVVASDAGEEYLLEAKVGLAMVNQFTEQGADLDKAEVLYNQVLEKNPPEEMQLLVQSFLADIHLSRGENDEAIEILDELIAESAESVIGQDALIRKIILTAGDYGTEGSVEVADEASAVIEQMEIDPSQERPYLLPVVEAELGMIYFWANQFEKAVEHLTAFTELGNSQSTSYGSQASTLYRIAKIYELDLKDKEKAGSFYRKIITEYPNYGISFYSLERAVELGAMTRSEVAGLNLPGLTSEILDELFSTESGEEN